MNKLFKKKKDCHFCMCNCMKVSAIKDLHGELCMELSENYISHWVSTI